MTRRTFAAAMAYGNGVRLARAQEKISLVSIALDCEMSAHYPTWDQTEWNYKKGDLDEHSKEYAVGARPGALRRLSGKMHFFIVGRVFTSSPTFRG